MSNEFHLERYNFKEYKEFDPNLVKLDDRVRKMCEQNTCGQYGKNHMCPPAVKSISEWEKEIASYKCGIIFTKMYQIEDSFDMEAMFEGAADFGKTITKLRENLKSEFPDKKILILGAGTCMICPKCAYIDKEPCRFPDKAYPSVEACGIDVMRLSKSAGVQYNNGKNTVTYIGLMLYT